MEMDLIIAWVLVFGYTIELVVMLVFLGVTYRYCMQEERELEEIQNKLRELDNNLR